MDIETLKPILKEILEEQKNNSTLLITIKENINELLEALEKQSYNDNSKSNQTEQFLTSKLDELNKEIGRFQTGQRVEKRILLFPETNAKEYYSVILKWLLYGLIATYLYSLLQMLVERF